MTDMDNVLVINAGSSSVKFQLFGIPAHDRLELRVKGQVDGIGTRPRLLARNSEGGTLIDAPLAPAEVATVPAALERALLFLREKTGGKLPSAIGHRVVHGGPDYKEPTVVTDTVLNHLERLAPLAPLHQLNNLAPIRIILARHPGLPQVACFDTAFHRGHPDVADRFAIPEDLHREGVRRYGFHGLSYEYIADRLPKVAPEIVTGRVLVAHLGSGASMCALVSGKSVESTMGFTALDGLPMGTRPGQLDPGIVLYLLTEKRMSGSAIQNLLYNECGLKGLSGISNDARILLADQSPAATFALKYFTYRISLFAGMLAAAMGGIDGFVFTAGIGENAPTVREAVLRRLSWLGAEVDPAANALGGPCISTSKSRIKCYVIPTDEELMIARHTLRVLREHAPVRREEKRA
jgi:acetate kinase